MFWGRMGLELTLKNKRIGNNNLIYENMKVKTAQIKLSPFDLENSGEKIDLAFFKRLLRFESYFGKQINNNEFRLGYEAMKKINQILQQPLLSLEEVRSAINVYNEYCSVFQIYKTGWYDLRLHLRHIAYIYGEIYDTDNNLRLIKKNEE